jgi:hypothetical protein
LNGTHRLLLYGDDIYLFEDKMNTVKMNIKVLIGVTRKKIKYMLMSC